jgi:succinate dehydrogenase / fumarate reductase cytochrome b subunit
LLHAIQGIFLWRKNKSARGEAGYAVKVNRTAGDVSRISSVNMGALGTVILVFILIHMYQFWLQMKMGNVEMLTYAGGEHSVKDLYTLVRGTFENVGFVVFYVASMGFIAFHLWHGFQSSFQTLGLNHRKYTPLIKAVGKVYSVLVPLGFAIIPLYMFLTN